MNKIILVAFVLFTGFVHAQVKPEGITAADLYAKIDQKKAPSFVVLWNPNCEIGNDLLLQYQKIIQTYGLQVDIYTVAITNMDYLLSDMAKQIDLNYPLYYIGGDQSINLRIRKEEFEVDFLKLLHREETEFTQLYIHSLDQVVYDNELAIDYAKLEALLPHSS
ncbi:MULTISPECIES: hypothetical protein [unclassified Myroides]|uniref:hypothetical protein n=1 Tax=unclassified Myroides TaxID=2642485 RepID=UPI003D2F5C3D